MRLTLSLVLWLILAAFSAPSAQDTAPDVEEGPQGCPVVLDGHVLFEVVRPAGSRFSADERAAAISARLVAVARDRSLAVPDVRAVAEENGLSLFAGSRLILLVRPEDAAHHGVTLERYAELLPPILERAIADYRAARTAPRLLLACGEAGLVLLVTALALLLYSRLYRRLRTFILTGTGRQLAQVEEALSTSVGLDRVRAALAVALSTTNALVWLAVLAAATNLGLSFFPQSRGFSSQMLGLVAAPLTQTGRALIASIPSLIFVAVVITVTRVLLHLNEGVFGQIERGKVAIAGFYPEWARPTRRIVSILLIVGGAVVAFPYIPGSDTAAFKSISILLGVVVSLGSTSVVSNFLNGLLLTYMRAFRVGDVVRIGDTLGTVLESGTMVTRLRTLHETEIELPNVVVMNGQVTNYSRTGTHLVSTAVTIGYGTPWRQVQAMLELAAAQTDGIRRDPAPFVLQSGLEDFYIRYELWVALDDPWQLPRVMAALHANIQDQFNQHGVQIMSPHYMADPPRPAVVPRDQWHLPPAR